MNSIKKQSGLIVIAVIVLVWFITALLTLDHAEAMQDEAQPEAPI